MRAVTTALSLIVVLAYGTLWPPAGVAQAGIDMALVESSVTAPGHHHGDCEHDRVRDLTLRGEILSLREILQRVRASGRGRVLDIELKKYRDGYVYDLLLVDEAGGVGAMKLDAASGRRPGQYGEE
jgi:uncharacterized membrane protein YkoI